MVSDREQLEALKRQIEEDYRLDMAAIERLQRRVMNSGGNSTGRSLSSAAAVNSAPSYLPPTPEKQVETPVVELPQPRQPDELAGTLRAMFSSVR